MRPIKNYIAAALAALLALPTQPFAQAYPTSTPTYIPNAILAPTTLSAAGTVTYQVNGVGTVLARITGSGTGIAGTFQIATERSGTINWTTIVVQPRGNVGSRVANIVGTGLYQLDVPGAAQVRFNLTAITGSITIDWSGGSTLGLVDMLPARRSTYSAIITALAPAASATDFFTLTGSATKTVRIQRAACSGISTAASVATVNALTRSTANTGGTATAPAASQHDSLAPAATATVAAYTANPTTGTLVGSGLRSSKISLSTAASSAIGSDHLEWMFGIGVAEEVLLRGVAQVFALNGAGASFAAGTSLNCSVQWTEE